MQCYAARGAPPPTHPVPRDAGISLQGADTGRVAAPRSVTAAKVGQSQAHNAACTTKTMDADASKPSGSSSGRATFTRP